MQNEAAKGHGYGTRAEELALEYAFSALGMNAVNADALIGATRSQHLLEKVGFRFVGEANGFRYYRRER